MAVEGQFNGIFHNTTSVAGWERRGGIWQLHAGKSLREETATSYITTHSLDLKSLNYNGFNKTQVHHTEKVITQR